MQSRPSCRPRYSDASSLDGWGRELAAFSPERFGFRFIKEPYQGVDIRFSRVKALGSFGMWMFENKLRKRNIGLYQLHTVLYTSPGVWIWETGPSYSLMGGWSWMSSIMGEATVCRQSLAYTNPIMVSMVTCYGSDWQFIAGSLASCCVNILPAVPLVPASSVVMWCFPLNSNSNMLYWVDPTLAKVNAT